jgi:DNA repair protein RadC
MKLKEFPIEDLPREKLSKFGARNLSNYELLAIILGSGNKKESVLEITSKLLLKYNLKKIATLNLATLQKENGIGNVNASKILASIELGKRASSFVLEKSKKISCAKEIAEIYIPEMNFLESENFRVVFLDSKNQIINSKIIFIGTLNESVVHPREIFKSAILENSANIILIHNHPSGDLNPSEEDIKTTKELVKAGEILGIKVLDHIIVGNNSFFSFLEEGLFE